MSQRIKSSLEVLTGIILIFGYFWLIYPAHSRWVQGLSAIPVLLFLLYSDFKTKKSFKDVGFRLDNWYGSFKILIIFTLIAIVGLYVIWQFFFPVNNYFYKESAFWKGLFNGPFEALFQEYIFLGFFFRRYRDIFFPHTNVAILFSALTFSLIHIPIPPLIILCFIAGIVWAAVYNKYPNLFTIAISHAILGIFCASVLLVYPVVGPNADIGRWCKYQDSVYGYIDTVDHKTPYKNNDILDVTIDHQKNRIYVEGWVASTEKIKNIRISLGSKDYSVHYGNKREDVAAQYKNPAYLYSGFNANIPVSDFAPGYHQLFLKVDLEGELFYHAPGERIWVELR